MALGGSFEGSDMTNYQLFLIRVDAVAVFVASVNVLVGFDDKKLGMLLPLYRYTY